MLSNSQALNLLSIFVPKKYKGLKNAKNYKVLYLIDHKTQKGPVTSALSRPATQNKRVFRL